MPPTTPLHIRPNARGDWSVEREGETQPLSVHRSETDAERAAASHADRSDATEIIVHDRYDRVHRAPSPRPRRSENA
jgi:hypothetical protein